MVGVKGFIVSLLHINNILRLTEPRCVKYQVFADVTQRNGTLHCHFKDHAVSPLTQHSVQEQSVWSHWINWTTNPAVSGELVYL
jgi:hypothetical protein